VGLFRKKQAPPPHVAAAAGLPTEGQAVPASLTAHSEFIKRSQCVRCGAPKTLPSKTAYLYCDYCGALVDYDFRKANAGTNAGLTNTVYHRLVAPLQGYLNHAKATGDRDAYRQLQLQIFSQWIEACPQAVSPRAKTDLAFRQQMVAYCAETTVCKDMDPQQQQMDAQMQQLIASLQRIPMGDGAWRVAGDFWTMAALWKQQMDLAYAAIQQAGIDRMDPDDPPPGVALKMEYSTFCQAWLPHLAPEDGERLLALYGLTGDYVRAEPQPTEQHRCGHCGAEVQTVVGARIVVCEDCGQRLDIETGAAPCRGCGAPLDYPVGTSRLRCPYCKTDTQRV
jgi:LSD1 subclass zinc finger protein